MDNPVPGPIRCKFGWEIMMEEGLCVASSSVIVLHPIGSWVRSMVSPSAVFMLATIARRLPGLSSSAQVLTTCGVLGWSDRFAPTPLAFFDDGSAHAARLSETPTATASDAESGERRGALQMVARENMETSAKRDGR